MAGIIVAGGSGFIGQEVVRAALNTRDTAYRGGHTVINIDMRPPRPLPERLGRNNDYFDVGTHPRVKFIQADLADPDQTARAVADAAKWAGEINCVANLAGLVRYGERYERVEAANVKTVRNLVRECAARKILFTHLSGTAVHGNGLRAAIKETDAVNPIEGYGRSKMEAELAIFREVTEHGLRAVVFRSTAPVGPDVQAGDMNKLYEMIVSSPIIPAVKGSNVTYVSTEDVGRAMVYAMENVEAVTPRDPGRLSDVICNLGVEKPFSDAQVAAHLQRSILGKVKKPIVVLPAAVVIAASYVMTLEARCENLVRRNKKDPVVHYELAKLFKGSHYQDPAKFRRLFEANGFRLKHDTPEKVLDTGTVYKFLTDWAERPKSEGMQTLIQQFLDERRSAAYQG